MSRQVLSLTGTLQVRQQLRKEMKLFKVMELQEQTPMVQTAEHPALSPRV